MRCKVYFASRSVPLLGGWGIACPAFRRFPLEDFSKISRRAAFAFNNADSGIASYDATKTHAF
jgi:hypothetical protein